MSIDQRRHRQAIDSFALGRLRLLAGLRGAGSGLALFAAPCLHALSGYSGLRPRGAPRLTCGHPFGAASRTGRCLLIFAVACLSTVIRCDSSPWRVSLLASRQNAPARPLAGRSLCSLRGAGLRPHTAKRALLATLADVPVCRAAPPVSSADTGASPPKPETTSPDSASPRRWATLLGLRFPAGVALGCA